MVIKVVEGAIDSFKDKLKNPFYGTLLVVWLIRNREFLFNLFFNSEYDSTKRLTLLREQFQSSSSIWNFILTILISLLIMAIIYIALNLSRFIVQFSEKTVLPKILKIFSVTSIVSREEYERIEKQSDYYQDRYSKERFERQKIQKELDELREKGLDFVESYEKAKIVDGGVIGDKETNYNSIFKVIIENKGLSHDFKYLINSVNSLDEFSKINEHIPENIESFKSMNIVRKVKEGSYYTYEFTSFGEKIRDLFLEKVHNY